ncbi:MAG: GPP34 family phosphoprotein [Proteobacteria bacterium]|nr:GPP34 family phosphoprotein [Pseudomonadota bacterium]
MWTLAHEFLLLALDDHTGQSLCEDDFALHASISAAFVAEMQFSGRLVPVAANAFALVDDTLSEGVLGRVEEGLIGQKPASFRKLMGWIRGWFQNRDLEGWLKEDLVRQLVLREEQDTFLFIPYRRRHPADDMGPEIEIKANLRHHLAHVGPEAPPCRNDALLSLLRAAKLLDVVFSETEQVHYRETLLERTRRAPIGRDAKQAADEARAAMMVAITS